MGSFARFCWTVTAAFLCIVTRASAADVTFGPVTASPGSSVPIPVSTTDITGLDLIGVDITIRYDTSVLTATAVDTGETLLDGWLKSVHLTSEGSVGSVSVSLTDGVAAADSGPLVYVLFDIGVAAGGVTLPELTISLNEGIIPATVTVGAITIDATPTFVLRNSWVHDPDGNHDAKAQPGERVRPRVGLRNDDPTDATNVRVTLTIEDSDITVVNGVVTHATWPAHTARNNDGFLLDIAPGATAHEVQVTVDVTADNGAVGVHVCVPH